MGDAEHYNSTARALAADYDDSDEPPILPISHSRRTNSPLWSRRSLDSSSNSRPRTKKAARWLQTADKYNRKALRLWSKLTTLQKSALVLFGLISFTITLLIIIYNEKFFAYLAPFAKKWRKLPAGWLILCFMTFFVSFPPMIGYSTCVTIAGFVFGMKGWLIMASATVIGSTVSFVVSRTVLKKYVSRMTEKNKRFTALSLVLKHDGLKLLVMIRLCPLPYSFANGAISTIPTVTWRNFAIATAIASPKLLLHIFVGARLGDIAENGDTMDFKTKVVSYVSAIVGMVVGGLTGYLIYARTAARAKELEAEEVGGERRSSVGGGEYVDDDDDEEGDRGDDALSLHTTAYEDDLDTGYRDEFTDDEDAVERDPFDAGDGPEDEETASKKGKQ
ncbi:Golgi apparatus membrane protein tvp38 [Pseudocercospora fuligena]|uniref:Golgi apparatus membrane protein TVP38 n=1 Tax=Pseudocercospora fuligena TaxID=685502 RepID=A0A8H6RM20_9PEZI|nr:Golgi apparatus membrane protein tvp38 [Pseudocercospora fuligena]